MYEFVKLMYGFGFDIKCYVVHKAITADQYQEITGEAYTA